ncbi:MAG: HAD-IIIC family phosphatase [Steroidobacteraceae bacterium]
MHWLPAPADFKRDLRAATGAPDPGDRLERLCALANQRLGLLETIQLDTALKTVRAAGTHGFPVVRIAILSHATTDHLLPAIRVAALRRRLIADCRCGSFGQIRQQLLDPDSAIRRFKPEILLLTHGSREALAGVALAADDEATRRSVADTVEDIRLLWRQAREMLGAQVIQQTMLDVTEPLFGNYDSMVAASPSRMVAAINQGLVAAAAQEQVLVLDIARQSARDGLDAWFDVGRWLQGKMEIAPAAAPHYGELLARLIGAQRGLSKKCLVLDLDNTLWGGVVGDAGVENIVLGEGSAAGEAHLALQRYARSLRQCGILLAVCSKNEGSIAEAAFREHPEMLLKREDFAAFEANWDDKAANIVRIATQLNIGIDSLVFVDDNPAERARIRESLPLVAVPELPEDPALYVRCLADAGYFDTVSFTEEDRGRVELYVANARRESLLGAAQSMEDFLRGLEMTVEYGRLRPVDLPRAAQLINKTNQFNATGIRLTAESLAQIAADPRNIALHFRLIDRFGDNGLVSVMLLTPAATAEGAMNIDNWVMSCRVFGRQLEHEAMNIAVEQARDRGARLLRATIIPTSKNAVIADLYGKLGFERLAADAADGRTCWELGLPGREPLPTLIHRRECA